MTKIKSVIETSHYKVGDIVYRVALRPVKTIPLENKMLAEEDEWLIHTHPKFWYTRGPAKPSWPYRNKLPKLNPYSFSIVVDLLRSKFVVEQFEVFEIIRCLNTGEFYYFDCVEWMGQSDLFDTDIAAKKELSRIKKMFKNWSSDGE
jgi:hypothetical protein